MAIARISDCEDWHHEYCVNYWQLNELELIGETGDGKPIWKTPEFQQLEARQKDLVALLGYVPAT